MSFLSRAKRSKKKKKQQVASSAQSEVTPYPPPPCSEQAAPQKSTAVLPDALSLSFSNDYAATIAFTNAEGFEEISRQRAKENKAVLEKAAKLYREMIETLMWCHVGSEEMGEVDSNGDKITEVIEMVIEQLKEHAYIYHTGYCEYFGEEFRMRKK